MSDETRLNVRVYYEDTDAGGIVYHASYVRFMERGRTEWLRERGGDHATLAGVHGVAFVVSRMSLEFLAPARLDAQLLVITRVTRLGPASVSLQQCVQAAVSAGADPDGARGDRAVLHCRAAVRLACVTAVGLQPARIPALIHDGIDTRVPRGPIFTAGTAPAKPTLATEMQGVHGPVAR